MIIYQFVGGSLDGLMQPIPPEMNYRVKVAHDDERDSEGKPYATEIYEITDFSRREYHFVGYEGMDSNKPD